MSREVELKLYRYCGLYRQIQQRRSDIIHSAPRKEKLDGRGDYSDATGLKGVLLADDPKIKRWLQEVEVIQAFVDTLPPKHRTLFEKCYRGRKARDVVCREMGIALRTYYQYKREIIAAADKVVTKKVNPCT